MKCLNLTCSSVAKKKGLCKKCYDIAWRKDNPDKAKASASKFRENNPEKYQAKQKEWRIANRRRLKGHHLRKYWPEATWEECLKRYDTLVVNSGNVCGICKLPETAIDWQTKNVKELAVDHCHLTGVVRGLLCQRHNHVLGLIGEDVAILASIIEYLKIA